MGLGQDAHLKEQPSLALEGKKVHYDCSMEFNGEAVEVTGIWGGLIRYLGFILRARGFLSQGAA